MSKMSKPTARIRRRLQRLYDHGMRCERATDREHTVKAAARARRARQRFLTAWNGLPAAERPTPNELYRAWQRTERREGKS